MKFLDETGLSYFLDKLKTFIKGKYVGINDPITITDKNGGDNKSVITNSIIRIEKTINGEKTYTQLEPNIFYMGDGKDEVSIQNSAIEIGLIHAYSNALVVRAKSSSDPRFPNYVRIIDDEIDVINNNTFTSIKYNKITSPSFVKQGGTSSQLLVADGSVAEFNKANGVPKLNANGKLDSSQVDALTNAEIDAIVI